MKFLTKTILYVMTFTLFGCSSADISPGQMSVVRDQALDGVSPDPLGGSREPVVSTNPPNALTGGGGL